MLAQWLTTIGSLSLIVLSSFSTVQAERRIIGGTDAQQGDWPWMVSLQTSSGHFCGGTLIDAYWVLTAAHCVDTFASSFRPGLRVAIGLHRRSELAQSELIQVERFFQHPDWDTYNYDSPNDIALLQLSQAAQSPPLSLAQPNSRIDQAGQLATALGWGATTISSGSSDVLQQVNVPLVSLSTCQHVYARDYSLIDSQLCAGLVEGGKDTCFGDSGGPLAVFDGRQWQQVGITSFGGKASGPPCAGEEAYGIYSRVSSFIEFVDSYVLSDLRFVNPAQFYSGEHWQMRLAENNHLIHPRPAVDLWLGIELGGELWFVNGSLTHPLLSLNASPWASNLQASQTEHLVLDLPIDDSFSGSYQVYAIYTEAGQGLSSASLRSVLATQKVSLNP